MLPKNRGNQMIIVVKMKVVIQIAIQALVDHRAHPDLHHHIQVRRPHERQVIVAVVLLVTQTVIRNQDIANIVQDVLVIQVRTHTQLQAQRTKIQCDQ